MKYALSLFLLLTINTLIFGQVNYSFKTITNNANTAYLDSIKNTKCNTVIFFCPTNEIDSTIFLIKGKELVSNKKLSSYHSIKIHFILFKEDPKNNSKGIIVSSKDKKSSMPIGQLECFFLNFDKNLVQRARSKDKFNFEYTQPFLNENLYRIQIVDTNKCFKEIPDRIPFYANFIIEAYSPSYSLEEKIDFLNDSIKTMQKKIVALFVNHELLISKLDSILKQNNLSSPKNVKTDKPLNQNPSKDKPQSPIENKPDDVPIDPNVKVNKKGKNK